MTKVLILCGGRGSRFDHESQVLPKPLIEVTGKPMLGHIMDIFESQGFDDFLIAGGYKWEKLDEYLKTRYECRAETAHDDLILYGNKGSKIKTFLINTGEDASTGDRVMRFSNEMFLTEPYFLTYGDGVCDVDLQDLLGYHEYNRGDDPHAEPMVTVTAVRPPGRFGVVEFFSGMDGLVKTFGEKPSEGWINGGFMVVDPGFIMRYGPTNFEADDLNFSDPIESFESGALTRAAADRSLWALRYEGYWRCMDTRRDLEQIEADVAANGGKLPWMREKDR